MAQLLTGILLLLFMQHSGAVESVDKHLDFKVFLNDREVGSHSFILQQQGESLLVSSTMSLDFTVLMIKKIKYRHQANEVWQGGCLVYQTTALPDFISLMAVFDFFNH